jgi:hypothetical protein
LVGGSTWRTSDDIPLYPKDSEPQQKVTYQKPRMAIAYWLADANKLIWYEVDSEGHEFSDEWSNHLTNER